MVPQRRSGTIIPIFGMYSYILVIGIFSNILNLIGVKDPELRRVFNGAVFSGTDRGQRSAPDIILA